jgi:hypothetical protein
MKGSWIVVPHIRTPNPEGCSQMDWGRGPLTLEIFQEKLQHKAMGMGMQIEKLLSFLWVPNYVCI